MFPWSNDVYKNSIKVQFVLVFTQTKYMTMSFSTITSMACAPIRTTTITRLYHKTTIRASTTCIPGGCTIPIQKKRVVVLGSGWGAISLAKNFPTNDENTELVFVSPRNYMLYTPLLPSVVGGVISETSVMEPVRNIVNGKALYYEARATDIDIVEKRITCDDGDKTFELDYDTIVCSVGSVSATFGIKGVFENCMFLKNMEDARRLRNHVNKCIERAALPCLDDDERKKLLSFVVVGGGPTGVEVAAEIYDLINEDIANKLPLEILDNVSITLVYSSAALLNSYDIDIQKYAGELFRGRDIKLRFQSIVKSVHPGVVNFVTRDGMDSVEFGTCVWSAGITAHPLVHLIRDKIGDVQDSNRGLIVDDRLRAIGAPDIICIGDAAIVRDKNYPPTAQVAAAQGSFIAKAITGGEDTEFSYFHKGSFVYLGDNDAAVDLPFKTFFLRYISGLLGAHIWKSYECISQFSNRTRFMVAADFLMSKMFGRNTFDS
jgi:NADH:ubiquinone reductase (non-electrogenic)